MGLQGRLEDLPFLDMLQIAAFSQKSGCLRVEGPLGSGAVVSADGLVYSNDYNGGLFILEYQG